MKETSMRKSFRIKALALAISLVCLAGAAAFAVTATGAYFSDTKSGNIDGAGVPITIAAGVNADFGGGLAISWPSMVPGEVYTATAHYTNTGGAPQDVWIVFPNETALSALNSLGGYGAAQIVDSNSGLRFYSNNLNDHADDQEQGPGPNGQGTVRMLPRAVKLASAVPVGGTGYMTFKFQYASKMGNGTTGANWLFNSYPVAGQTYGAGGASGNGLPYQIVATQVGIEPGAAGSYAGF
jgi:hypothetical protein